VRMRRLREAPQHYKAAEEKYREVYDSLPKEFRESYSARQQVRFRNWKSGSRRSETQKDEVVSIGGKEEGSGPPVPARGRAESASAATAEESLSRVSGLMTSLLGGGTLESFLDRLLEDLLAALRADAAFLLRVQGRNLSVEAARAAAGKTLLDPEDVLCLGLIEKVLAGKKPLLIADLADDPQAAKALEEQKLTVSSLAVVSTTAAPDLEAALYVLNPQLPRGGGAKSLLLLQPFLNLVPLAFAQLRREAVV